MLTPNEKLRACVERARALPEQVRKRLEPVPTDPYEAFLMWDPEELRQDRPLTFYRKLKSKRFKAPVIYPLPVAVEDSHYTSRLHGKNWAPQYRRRIKTMYKGKIYTFLCSNLTMLCILQFRRENPHVNVIEHLIHAVRQQPTQREGDGTGTEDAEVRHQGVSGSEETKARGTRGATHRTARSCRGQC